MPEWIKRLCFYLYVCVCVVSEGILPCFVGVDTVQQHLQDYVSLWKVTISVSFTETCES